MTTRVCLKSDSDVTGRIVGKGEAIGEVLVQWDDQETPHNIRASAIRPLVCAEVIETLERLRDDLNLALGCAIEDIKRVRQ